MTSIIIINCPQRSFIYNEQNFIKSGNKGNTNHGQLSSLDGVNKAIDTKNEGLLSYVNNNEGKIYRVQTVDFG